MIIYKYIFYRLYSAYLKQYNASFASLSALIFVSWIMIINLSTIWVLLDRLNIVSFLSSSFQGVFFFVSLMIVNYFLFIHKKKYLDIVDEMQKLIDSKKYKFLNIYFSILFVISSIVILFLVALIRVF